MFLEVGPTPETLHTHVSLRLPAKPGSPGQPQSSPGKRGLGQVGTWPRQQAGHSSGGRFYFDFSGSCPDTLRSASKHPLCFQLRTLSSAARGPGGHLARRLLGNEMVFQLLNVMPGIFHALGKIQFCAHTRACGRNSSPLRTGALGLSG